MFWRIPAPKLQGDQLMVRGDYTGAYNAYTEAAAGMGAMEKDAGG